MGGQFRYGTGEAHEGPMASLVYQLHQQVARLVIEQCGGVLEYVPLPASLRASYQLFTEADLRSLRAAGYTSPMTHPVAGIRAYPRQLSAPVRGDVSRLGHVGVRSSAPPGRPARHQCR